MNFIRGFCMALADSVPGVSGGTIAFLLGFYDKFIGSLNALIGGTKEERKDGIIFLIKILTNFTNNIEGNNKYETKCIRYYKKCSPNKRPRK